MLIFNMLSDLITNKAYLFLFCLFFPPAVPRSACVFDWMGVCLCVCTALSLIPMATTQQSKMIGQHKRWGM